MHNQSLQLASLPEIPLRQQPKSDIPKPNLHITQEIEEKSTPSDNINQYGTILELAALADLFEKDSSRESSEEAEAIPKLIKAPSQRAKSAVVRQGSGETTDDFDHLAISVPENTSQVSQQIRKQFIRKVLLILLSQLVLTCLIVGMAFIPDSSFRNGVQNQPIVALITVIVSLVCLVVLVCKRSILRKVPWNYILLFAFTCSSAYSLAFIASFTESTIVLISAIFTLVIVIGATAFAFFSKTNPSRIGYFLCQVFPLMAALIIAGLVFRGQLIQVAISAGVVLIFSVHLTFDLQRVVGKFESKYTLDDYILASLDIYIDVYLIFVEMIKLFQNLLQN